MAVGTAKITATDPGTGLTGATTLTVTAAQLVSIGITPVNPSIALGTTQQFTAMGIYTDSTTQDLTTLVTWTSSTTSVATISNASGSKGLATSVAVGTTTISAIDSATGINGSTTLTVTPAVLVSLAVTPTNPSIAKGTTQQFTAIGTYSDSTTQHLTDTVTWTSSATNVATVSNADGSRGLATSLAVGSTTITATSGSISGTTTLTVTLIHTGTTGFHRDHPHQPLNSTGTYASVRGYRNLHGWDHPGPDRHGDLGFIQ